MDLRSLRYCATIAELGSMTRAAEVLRVAQPALSRAIQNLEEELGVTLLVRGQNRPVTPTAEGKILLRHADRIFQEIGSAMRELDDARELRTGEISIGMPPMYGQSFFSPLLARFHAAHPGVTIKAIEGSAGEVGGLLDSGKVDLAVLESRRIRSGWRHQSLGEDELVLCVRKDHPLAKRNRIGGKDLDGLDVVLFDETFIQRNMFDQFCERAGAKYKLVMESNYVPMILDAAALGVGATTLMRSLVDESRGLVGISLDPVEKFRFELCWLDERYLSKANQAFLEFALEPQLVSKIIERQRASSA